MRQGDGLRAGAAATAGVAAAGLLVQYGVTAAGGRPVGAVLWILAGYFTILTNGLAVVVYGSAAAGWRGRGQAAAMAGTMLSLVLVGAVYWTVLHGPVALTGRAAVADLLLHLLTPVAAAGVWVGFAEKGLLRWRDPWLWAVYPLLYLGYALWRGAGTGVYAYPFLNGPKVGWGRVGEAVLVISVGFLAAGFGLVGLDRVLGRGGGERDR